MGTPYLAGSAVLAGGLMIVVGGVLLATFGAGWAGWLRLRRLLEPGAVQQGFAGGILGGPAAIVLGVFLLRASTGAHPPMQATDAALFSAGLALVVAAVVLWNWKPRWLEPSWVRGERAELERRRMEDLRRRYGIDDTAAAPLAMGADEDVTGQFGVAGFDSPQEYEAGEPTWGEDLLFPSEDEAVAAARAWLASLGSEAQVEIHHFVSDRDAEVVAVVTQGAIERIG